MKGYKLVKKHGSPFFGCDKCRFLVKLASHHGSARTAGAKEMNEHIRKEHPEPPVEFSFSLEGKNR